MAADGQIVLGLNISETTSQIESDLSSVLGSLSTKQLILKTAIEKTEAQKSIANLVKEINSESAKIGIKVDNRDVSTVLSQQKKIASTQDELNRKMEQYKTIAAEVGLVLKDSTQQSFKSAIDTKNFDAAKESLRAVKKEIDDYNAAVKAMNSDTKLDFDINNIVGKFAALKTSTTEVKSLFDKLTVAQNNFANATTTSEKLNYYNEIKKTLSELEIRYQSIKQAESSLASNDAIKKNLQDTDTLLKNLKTTYSTIGDSQSAQKLKKAIGELESELQKVNREASGGELVNQWVQVAEKINAAKRAVSEYKTEQAVLSGKTDILNNITDKLGALQLNIDTSGIQGAGLTQLYETMTRLKAEAEQLRTELSDLDPTNGEDVINLTNKIEDLQRRFQETAKSASVFKDTSSFQKFASDIDKAKQKVNEYASTYSAIKSRPELVQELERLKEAAQHISTPAELKQFNSEFDQFNSKVVSAGANCKSFGDQLKSAFKNFSAFFSASRIIYQIIASIKQMVANVKELDSAMVELRKVTDATDAEFNQFLSKAKTNAVTLGSTVVDLVNATSDFSRLGYSLKEAEELGKIATIYANVGDDVNDISQATTSLVSTMKGFGLEASDALSIIDKFNEVGNNFAISSGGIGDALQRSAAALHAANNTIDESIALIVAANNVIQNPDVVGNMWKTVSMRIRGATAELEEAGLETEGMAKSTSDLRKEVMALTDVYGDGGFDIMLDESNFKSTYDIILGIGKVWQDISDVDQAALLELLAGKRQGNALAAALTNLKDLEAALESAENSAGSAMREQEIWLGSLEAKINQFKAAFESLSSTVINSDFLKGIVDIGTKFLTLLDNIIQGLGGMGNSLLILVDIIALLNFNKTVALIQSFWSALQTGFGLIPKITSLFNNLRAAWVLGAESGGGFISSLKGMMAALTGTATAASIATAAIIAIVAVIAIAVVAYKKSHKSLEELQEDYDELADKVETAASNFRNLKDSASDVIPRFVELAKGVDKLGNNVSLTDDEYAEFLKLNNKIAEMFPEINMGMDSNGNAMLALSYSADTLTASLNNLVEAQRNAANQQIADTMPDILQNIEDTNDVYEREIRKLRDIKDEYRDVYNDFLNQDLPTNIGRYSTLEAGRQAAEEFIAKAQELGIHGSVMVDDQRTTNNGYVFSVEWDYSALEGNIMGGIDYVEQQYDIAMERYDRLINDYQARIAAKWAQLNPIVSSWVQTDFMFQDLNDQMKQIAQVMVSGLDFSSLGLTTQEDVQRYVDDNIIEPLFLASPEIKDAFSSILDWQSQLKDGTLSTDEFTSKIKDSFTGMFEYMQPDTIANFKSIFVSSFNEMGIAGNTFDAVLNAYIQDLILAAGVTEKSEESFDGLKETLENLWNSSGFSDTKKAIIEMANSLDGITADNISELVDSSSELASILEQDGMSAKFLAHILQTEAMGGDGFALITEDALALNGALEGLKVQFSDVADAKSRFDAAMDVPEKDTDFRSYVEAFEILNEQFVAGTTNSNAFWAAAEFLFGADQLQLWGWADGLDQIYEAMQRNVSIFQDADSAGAGFLDRLYQLSEAGEIKAEDGSVIAEIKKLSDGSYDFHFDTENIDLLAEKMGITREAALACMEALSMYGDFQFYDIETVMSTIKEIGLASDSINGTAVNVGMLTDQLISLGYTNKDIYDLLTVLREVDGITLLDANANVDTLKQSLIDLGLAAQDGVEVTINADGLADLMSQLNFTKEDTQALITKLGEADGITLTNAEGEVISLNDALAHTDELTFASVTSELDAITDAAELAQQSVKDLQMSINTLKGKTVTVTVDIQRKTSILGSLFGYAKGTKGAPEGDALVGEEGEELVQSGDRAYLVGTNGPEIVHLNEGDTVYTADETKKIKQNAKIVKGTLPAYAGGTFNPQKQYPSVLPDSSSSSKNNTVSVTVEPTVDNKALEEQLEETLKAMQDTINDVIGNYEHEIFLAEHHNESAEKIISIYKSMQEYVHEQADAYRKLGLDENSDYIQDLQKQWWDYQDSIKDLMINAYEDFVGEHENAITLNENWLNNAIKDHDYTGVYNYTKEIIDHYKKMQEAIHEEAEYYRSLGYSDTSDEVSKLSDLWWKYQENITNAMSDAFQEILDLSHSSLDEIQGFYSTLQNAAEEYAESGFIMVDTLQDICSYGVQYLAFLQDENGQLVINEESIRRVIAARTEQMAVETALNYVQQLRTALENNDIITLNNLIYATEMATGATWDLVYAQLRLLDLNDDQYNAAISRVNALRSLTASAVSGIGQVTGGLKAADEQLKKTLKETSDYLDDLLKYVIEMIKQEVKNQVKVLENQIDDFKEIIKLQKESLKLEKEKDEYTKKVKEKTAELAEIQKRLYLLDLDDSREAQAEKAKLQEQLAKLQEELADDQADHAYDATVDMLDDMADAYEKEKKKEIAILEDTISSYEKLYRLAIDRINNHWDTLYQDLIDWNYQYGSVTNDEITAAWNAASQAVQQYGSYLNAVLQIQQQLAALEAKSSSSSVGMGSIGSSVVGNSGDYDTSGGQEMENVHNIIKQMYANSQAWGKASESERQRLDAENLKLGQSLSRYGISAYRSNGTWYVSDGSLLYDKYKKYTYHDGGIVGDEPTLKQDELFAKLKKREAVLTEEQQEPVYQALDFADTMYAKYGRLFNAVSDSNLLSEKMDQQIKHDAQQAQSSVENIQYNVTVTAPVQVYPLQKLDDSEIRQLTKKISDNAISQINDGFYKSGAIGNRRLLKPRGEG